MLAKGDLVYYSLYDSRVTGTYMKPAPPVIMIFLVPGRGSNFVLPTSTGASFQTP